MKRARVGIWQWVIIGLIALVVGWILIPTRAGFIPPTYSSCRTNLKQMALSAMIYMADFDDHLMHRDRWMDQCGPYLKNEALFQCPTVRDASTGGKINYGYAMNSLLSEADASKIKQQDLTPLFYDSSSLWRNASDPVASLPNPPRLHGKAAVNLMVNLDGSFEFFKAGAPVQPGP